MGQKKLDIFFRGMLIRIALNEYSFTSFGDNAKQSIRGNLITLTI
jgi:hypothetical protein